MLDSYQRALIMTSSDNADYDSDSPTLDLSDDEEDDEIPLTAAAPTSGTCAELRARHFHVVDRFVDVSKGVAFLGCRPINTRYVDLLAKDFAAKLPDLREADAIVITCSADQLKKVLDLDNFSWPFVIEVGCGCICLII